MGRPMTRQQKDRALKFAVGLPALGTVAFFLINTAFVSHGEMRPRDAALDSLRVGQSTLRTEQAQDRAATSRILCYLQAENHERPVSECVR